ncbi:MAG TPA: hypothetical protein DD640_10860 [Clostridiales bacterium]|nr:hypothetical protein [Clostridiales bacterium]
MTDLANRPARRRLSWINITGEIAGLACLLFLIVCLAAGYAWIRQSRVQVTAGLNETSAEAIVRRGSVLIGLEETAAVWSGRLAAGEASLADYLLRLFVSPDYLARDPTDEAFLADVWQVLTGAAPEESELASAANALLMSGSRLAGLNDLLQRHGYSASLPLPANATRLRTLALADGRPADGSEITGLMPITVETRLTGPDVCFKLFVDGQMRSVRGAEAEDPTLMNTSTIEWDTRREQPGRHSLALLVLTGDGRGRWLDLDEYTVPRVTILQTGEILTAVQDWGKTAWYLLPVQDSQALLTILPAGQSLDLLMLDLYGNRLAETQSAAGQLAALRSLTEGDSCYVKVAAAGKPADQQTAAYTLAAAYAIASPPDEPERLLSVLAADGDEVLIQNESGQKSWQPAADFELQDPTARLSSLELILPDGRTAAIAQAFDPEDVLYGLYVAADTARLQLTAGTMEGSAASLEISVLSGQDKTQILTAGQPVPLSPSVNRLLLTVTRFDGSERVYEVNILRPPHAAGYEQILDPFPQPYRSPLWLLHVQHPDWQFQAVTPEVSWAEFIAAQDMKDFSLVDSAYSPGWVEPDSPVYDGTSWKAARTDVIEYFADPRNFLNDVDIFQFEDLGYNARTHTLEGISAIIEDSFMAAGNGKNIDYAAMLAEAGQTAGISPYYLAAKIIQEMGRDGRSPLAHGQLTGYEGVYNFYNIGSKPNPDVENGALINGALYALYGSEPEMKEITEAEEIWLLPWLTPERAITGGAIWIARRYVQVGQNTLYLQKFDLASDGGYFTHQYAQNIQMAWSEARTTRQGYAGLGILDEAFIFQIPAFPDLPNEPTLLPPK